MTSFLYYLRFFISTEKRYCYYYLAKTKVNNEVCRVDFDEAWIRTFANNDESTEQGPYPDIASVPDSISKILIRNIGRLLFIEPFAVFPVSYLDNDLIVFDFELLGTRICARKEGSWKED